MKTLNGNMIYQLLNNDIKIADLGCGKLPQYFYNDKLNIDCYDKYADNDFKNFYKTDITKLYEKPELKGKYDLVIGNHIFEHIQDLNSLFKTLSHILKPNGLLYCSIPDGTNFTDIFYRLIHKHDSGGHINKWCRIEFTALLYMNNFELVKYDNWMDDFVWFEKCFDLKYNQCSITDDERKKLVKILRKELTADKGYYYGYEFIFRKVA